MGGGKIAVETAFRYAKFTFVQSLRQGKAINMFFSLSSFFQKTKYSLNYLFSHPEMQRIPKQIIGRLLLWEIYKIVRYQPKIRIHDRAKMRLIPGKRRGIHGLIFIFRDRYETGVLQAINQFCLPGAICYDIGANIGLWSIKLSEVVGDAGRVYAFEPFSKSIELLRENLAMSGCQNIEVVPVGLGDKDSICKIYVPADPGRAALSPESLDDTAEDIEIKRLDDIWEAQGCPKVGFCKIDVEGSEPFIIEGGAKVFSQVRPVVCCEINPFKLYKMGKTPQDIFQKFSSWNYQGFIWSLDKQDFVKFKDVETIKGDLDVVFIPN